MPPQPPLIFDYYNELEVERTASLTQITSSYRNLARVHHPDRNFGREREATARFQRIQQAYEILSNPVGRRNYDNSTSSSTSGSSSFWNGSYHDEDEETGGYNDFSRPDSFPQPSFTDETSHSNCPCPRHSNTNDPTSSDHYHNTWEQVMSRYYRLVAARQQEYFSRYRERCRQQAEAFANRRRREEEQKAERDALRTARQAAETAAKARAREEERQSQEQRWSALGAVAEDEKLRTCLHSDFCAKVEQKKKHKCTACSQKRGMVAFECPYCSSSLCQLCVSNFSTERHRLAKEKAENPAASPTQESSSNDGAAAPAHADEPLTTEPETSSSQQHPSQDENRTSEEKNGSSASTSNILEEEETNLVPEKSTQTPGRQMSDEAESSLSEQPDSVANQASHEETSQEAATPTGQATTTTTTTQTLSSGPTQPLRPQPTEARPSYAFVRPTKQRTRITEQMLRPVMEGFGAVAYIRMRGRAAHVGFSDQQALLWAMAASPVALTADVSVKIVQLKVCDNCGKLGHLAEQCWAEI